ncbi:MAG: toll/interleukin-1 receptor domain-containing protein [Acetatifactor sp.]|nr:toll/interleukin-1 receptor domain-containing protein [Acetatifactor sp.]MDE7114694.1 toll/interleukin-1 receptor domain-containing protein [Acetatifactor sp.]
MDMKQYRYKAFISYRHLPLDKEVAVKLQKMLESYRLPRGLRKEKESWRIFRDESELPTSNNLSDNIREALVQSEFLIVLCSKATKESRWCMEEITFFKSLHGGTNENIITVLVDGNPSEVFPKELCTVTKWINTPEGRAVQAIEEVEPLAANIAADSVQKTLKKLRGELLRIVAPLAGCRYDDLYQRHQRRKIRQILTVSISGLTLVSVIACITTILLLVISGQNERLQENAMVISEQNEQLQENTIDISNRMASLLLENANREEAVKTILESFDYVSSPEKICGTTESILTDALYAYETSPDVKQDHVFATRGAVLGGEYNDDCSLFLAYDENRYVYVWDVDTGEVLLDYKVDEYLTELTLSAFFHGNDHVMIATPETLQEINVRESTQPEWGTTLQPRLYACARDEDTDMLLLQTYGDWETQCLAFFNPETKEFAPIYSVGEILSELSYLEGNGSGASAYWLEHLFMINDKTVDFNNGKCAVLLTCTAHSTSFVLFLDTEKEDYQLVQLPKVYGLEAAGGICFIDSDRVAVRVCGDGYFNICIVDPEGEVSGSGLYTGAGQSSLKDHVIMRKSGRENKPLLVMGVGATYLMIDLESFEIYDRRVSNAEICNIEYYKDMDEGFFVFYEDGKVYRGTADTLRHVQTVGSYVENIFVRGDDRHYAVCSGNECEIVLYSRQLDQQYHADIPFSVSDDYFIRFQYSADGSKYMYRSVADGKYYAYDAESKELIGVFEMDGSHAVLWSHYFVCSGQVVKFYDLYSGELEKSESQGLQSSTYYADFSTATGSFAEDGVYVTKDGNALFIVATDQIKKVTEEETAIVWKYEEAVHKRIADYYASHLSDDGKWIFVQMKDTDSGEKELALINLEDGSIQELLKSEDGMDIISSKYAGIAFSHDNKTAAYSEKNIIHVCSLDEMKTIKDIEAQEVQIQQMVFTPESDSIITYTADGYLRKYDIETGELTGALKLDERLHEKDLDITLTMDTENRLLLVSTKFGLDGAVFVYPDTMQCKIQLLDQSFLQYWPETKEIWVAGEAGAYAYYIYSPKELVDKSYDLLNHTKK